DTGPTGGTGPTGTVTLNQYWIGRGEVSGSINNGQDLPFTLNIASSGTDITLQPNNTVFSLAPGHTYQITFSINSTPTGGALLWAVTLAQAGQGTSSPIGVPARTEVPATQSTGVGFAYITIPAEWTGGLVTIQYIGGGLTTATVGSINILELF
ncbi:hypothetical protein CN602_28945, partial [Bacillus cereus]